MHPQGRKGKEHYFKKIMEENKRKINNLVFSSNRSDVHQSIASFRKQR